MKIVADMSLYPLKDGPIPNIIEFIEDMQEQEGVEIVTNQLSSQLRGEFEAVTSAINHCMGKAMKAVNGEVAGRADGRRVAELVKSRLA